MGEEIVLENGQISDFQGLVTLTLTLNRVCHTAYRHASLVGPLPTCQISLKSKKLSVDGRTLETHCTSLLWPWPLLCTRVWVPYLEKHACASVLIGRHAEQSLRVEDHGLTIVVVRGPHSRSTRRLEVRRLEHFCTIKQGMIQRVWLAVTGVAKNRHNFHGRVGVASQTTNELVLVSNLHIINKIKQQRHSYGQLIDSSVLVGMK